MKKDQLKTILKTCFWEYNFTEDDIISLAKSQNQQEQMFLFTKILENATELIKSMKIFDKKDLESLIYSTDIQTRLYGKTIKYNRVLFFR